MVHAASKGHGKVANAVGERHGEKHMQWARGKVVIRGTGAEARGMQGGVCVAAREVVLGDRE